MDELPPLIGAGRHRHVRSCTRSRTRSAESATLAEAAPRMLAAVCEALGWEYGALWEVDRGGRTLQLRRHVARPVAAGRRVRRQQPHDAFARGVGPAGTGLGVAAGRPGSPTSSPTPIFRAPRRRERVGLHGAFALPILRGGDVLGVMEFFSRDIRQPDAALLER